MTKGQPKLFERWHTQRSVGVIAQTEAGYRRRVVALKWVLPAAALALALAIGWSWMNPTITAFRASYSFQEFSLSGQDEMVNPRFLGVDSRGQRYTVTAEVAMRPIDGSEQVFLIKPVADITMAKDEWMTLTADQGIYDRHTEVLFLSGAVSIYADNGFEMHTSSAQFDLAHGIVEGRAAVQGQGPWGLLDADGFRYTRDNDVFHFSGRPTLVLYLDPMDSSP